MLGGISGYDAAETTDEDPERVAFVQQLTMAYLQSALYAGNSNWQLAGKALIKSEHPLGKIIIKL